MIRTYIGYYILFMQACNVYFFKENVMILILKQTGQEQIIIRNRWGWGRVPALHCLDLHFPAKRGYIGRDPMLGMYRRAVRVDHLVAKN